MNADNGRVWNFSAGPAALPLPVLERIRDEMLVLPGVGASILEISHRSPAFRKIAESSEERLRRLYGISDAYEVLLLQGGSRLQFTMIPMNLLPENGFAEYLTTGSWSAKAIDEAKRIGDARAVWSGKDDGYRRTPGPDQLGWSPGAAYRYFASNETIQGVQFDADPSAWGGHDGPPLVCDASSDFLSRPAPIESYGVLYACAQKNAGAAGLTVVIARRDLLESSRDRSPGYLSFWNHVEQRSMYNTPPTFAIYVFDLILQWLEETAGGLAPMAAANRQKAQRVYDALDAGFYLGHADLACRSIMNVTFRLPDADLESRFLEEAKGQGLHNLAGHRSVGGVRASLYNAMPLEGADALAEFMSDFANRNG